MIRVMCPHCRRTYRTMTEGMGKTAVCTKCGQTFRIGQARPPFEWQPSSLAEDSWIGVAPPEEPKVELRHCILCEAPMKPGEIRCPACGANQVTGTVTRRSRAPADLDASWWSALPIGRIVAGLLLVAVLAGVYFGIRAMFVSAAESGVEIAQQRIIARAARHLAEGGDEYSLGDQPEFVGRVTDENLPRFLKMLGAGDPMIRRAAGPLIACGTVTRLEPILALTEATETAEGALAVLRAMGPRRLLRLCAHQDPQVSREAVRALGLTLNIRFSQQEAADLAAAATEDDRIALIGRHVRPWPRATGDFGVRIDGQDAPLTVRVEQIGPLFLMRVGRREFVSSYDRERTFAIPVAEWCAATGPAVDAAEVRRLMRGTVTLLSPFGEGWSGTITLTMQEPVTGTLPGFLPVAPPRQGETISGILIELTRSD